MTQGTQELSILIKYHIKELIDVGGGYYELQLRNDPSYCVDESQSPPANGSNVQAWQYGGNDRQQWQLVAVP